MAYETVCAFDENTSITLILFKNVSNSAELREKVREIDCSLLKASMFLTNFEFLLYNLQSSRSKIENVLETRRILDKFQALVAINKSILKKNTESMITRSVLTEIIYNMSSSSNISDSLSKFGIGDDDRTILAVILNDTDGKKAERYVEMIKGEVTELNELCNLANETLIKKVYKIKDPELKVGTLLDAVVSHMATKGI